LGFAALLLVSVYVLPLWRITLDAPQYPEGIGLVIRVNAIEGQEEGNLASINGLNHYIGMKPIDPEAIPELDVLPWAFGGLILLGLAAAASGRRSLHTLWLVLFALVMVGSLVRFYQWGYDYGHDLNPHAAIKVPGMAYQPPLIGSKKILNFTAHSWPALGGYAAALSFVLGAVAWAMNRRKKAVSAVGMAAVLVGLGGTGVLGCAPQHPSIDYGVVACAHCRMTVSDTKFGAQLVTNTGKTETFDSIECLASYVKDLDTPPKELYVTDFEVPGTLLSTEEAFFLHSDHISSPMGGGLAAFSSAAARDAALARLGGDPLGWGDVVQHLPAQARHAHR